MPASDCSARRRARPLPRRRARAAFALTDGRLGDAGAGVERAPRPPPRRRQGQGREGDNEDREGCQRSATRRQGFGQRDASMRSERKLAIAARELRLGRHLRSPEALSTVWRVAAGALGHVNARGRSGWSVGRKRPRQSYRLLDRANFCTALLTPCWWRSCRRQARSPVRHGARHAALRSGTAPFGLLGPMTAPGLRPPVRRGRASSREVGSLRASKSAASASLTAPHCPARCSPFTATMSTVAYSAIPSALSSPASWGPYWGAAMAFEP